ncbi:hypothetical protein M2152_001513 [Microbacteriaceae bacterium SG_E_30_P1]|uniref:Uncharacterized protein n=1 Tax=Antiquaquibacter oligotrophicus TaxID=2880260 RepID=A0ABT6KNG1_9MICO|nr:hypothetical protein [Antiquaquibacter oligotrophicus]MDH6181331.1 hypothetical protein [Antiquaquibacter oligotrophicus]UDF12976.1 hypothetical protein LH407_12550 [Antiquaquibacter oligotrophicus]
MPVFKTNARIKADRVAAIVGVASFAAGLTLIAFETVTGPPPEPSVTTVTSPLPGGQTTTTTDTTAPPFNSTSEPRVTHETSVTEGAPAVVTVTSGGANPWLGSPAATAAAQLLLVTAASLLLALATRRVLLGEYGVHVDATGPGSTDARADTITELEAAATKHDVAAARETPDLSRPLFAGPSVNDPRLRVLQHRISLELDVRTLAQNNDLPSGLTIPYVVDCLVAAKRMSPQLGSAVVALSEIGERVGHGATVSLDATTLLTEAYSGALAKVGGRIR